MRNAACLQVPMPLAEAAECCGVARWGTVTDDRGTRFAHVCDNCPLLIEPEETPDVLRAARAL